MGLWVHAWYPSLALGTPPSQPAPVADNQAHTLARAAAMSWGGGGAAVHCPGPGECQLTLVVTSQRTGRAKCFLGHRGG